MWLDSPAWIEAGEGARRGTVRRLQGVVKEWDSGTGRGERRQRDAGAVGRGIDCGRAPMHVDGLSGPVQVLFSHAKTTTGVGRLGLASGNLGVGRPLGHTY